MSQKMYKIRLAYFIVLYQTTRDHFFLYVHSNESSQKTKL